jgi:hypothetical protein
MWARTRPTPEEGKRVWFSKDDGAVLKEAARQFRLKEPNEASPQTDKVYEVAPVAGS